MERTTRRILLVDDDEDDFFITRTMLAESRQVKFIVDWASSYEKGLRMILAGGYDAVLMDYDLGRRTGIDLVREVTAEGVGVPILLLTGRGNLEIDLEAMEAGVTDYLSKNEINAGFLERSIRYAIEQKRSQQELMAANQALSDANTSLAAGRQEFREMIESISDHFLVLDNEWRFVYLNRRTAQAAGSEPAGLLGQVVWDVFPSLVNSPLWHLAHRVKETRVPGSIEWHATEPEEQWFDINVFPTAHGVSFYYRDISEKVFAEQSLEQERMLLKTALDQMLSGVIIAEAPSGRLLLFNRQAETIWRGKYQPAQGISEYAEYPGFFPDGESYRPEDWPLARSLRSAEVVRNEEIKIRRGDGSFGYIQANSTPVFNPQGKMTAAVSIIVDITERKRSELDNLFLMELTDWINRIENPQQLLDSIASGVARHLDVSRCIFTTIDLAQGKLTLERDYPGSLQDYYGSYNLLIMGEGVVSELSSGRPVVVRDVTTDPIITPPAREFHDKNDIRSFLAIPLLHGGVWKASMSILDSRVRNWNERQIIFLQTVAERAWAAYETRRLVVELRASEERAHQMADFAQSALNRLETVIDSMGEAVILTENEVYNRINPAAVSLFGFGSEEEMKKTLDRFGEIFEAVTPDGIAVPYTNWPHARAARGETVVNFEMLLHRKDTGRSWVGLYSAIPIRGPQGEVAFVLETITDITPIRQAEQKRGELDTQLQLQHFLVEQREQERLQIARNLHDGPIQSLIGVIFSLQSVEAITEDESLLRILSSIRGDAQRLVAEMRGVCNELRPPMLDTFGLSKAIRSHAEELRKRNPGLQLSLELEEVTQINDEVRLALYRIFQEILNNIIRHASATEVSIRLAVEAQHIVLRVQDNGVGFELPGDWLSLARQGHLGLVGIKERVDAIGAALEIISSPDSGTMVQVTLDRKS